MLAGVGLESSISRCGARLHSGGIHVRGVQRGSHSDSAEGTAQLPRALNWDKESCKHLRWTHLEQVQHCTDLPRQVTFPAHTEQGKMGPGLGRTLPLIKRNRRMRRRRRAGEKKK